MRQNLLDPIGPELCLISRPNAYEPGFDVNHIIRYNKTNLKNFLDNCSGVVLGTLRFFPPKFYLVCQPLIPPLVLVLTGKALKGADSTLNHSLARPNNMNVLIASRFQHRHRKSTPQFRHRANMVPTRPNMRSISIKVFSLCPKQLVNLTSLFSPTMLFYLFTSMLILPNGKMVSLL